MQLLGVLVFQSERPPERPSVEVRNSAGQQRRLFFVDSWEETLAKRDRVEEELKNMSMDAWADRYSIPMSFIRADPLTPSPM